MAVINNVQSIACRLLLGLLGVMWVWGSGNIFISGSGLSNMGFEHLSAATYIELRTEYGALHLGLMCILALGLLKEKWTNPVMLFFAIMITSGWVGRAFLMAVEGVSTPYLFYALGFEIIFSGLCWIGCLHSR